MGDCIPYTINHFQGVYYILLALSGLQIEPLAGVIFFIFSFGIRSLLFNHIESRKSIIQLRISLLNNPYFY